MFGLAPLILFLLALSLTVLALSSSRDRKRITLAEGRRLLESGQSAEALAVFDRLARRSKAAPGREAALFWLGQTLETLERRDAARRVYLRYLADYELATDGPRPTPEVHERVRSALAGLLQEPQEEPGPSGAWDRYLREGQVNPTGLLPLGEIRKLMEAGRFQAALAQLVRHVAQRPEAPGREAALHLLGLCYEGLGRPEQARTVYRRYMREYGDVGPRQPSTRILLQVADRLHALEPAGDGQSEGAWARFKGELRRIKDHILPEEAAAAGEPGERVAQGPTRVDEVDQARDRAFLDRGLRVGEYVLAEKLGDGGFGEVFRALRPVAIKFARDPEAVEHLKRFAEVQGRLQSTRIVRALEIDLEAEPPYVAMEFVDGPTLRDLLRHRRALPAAAALQVLLEVARGLQDAHQAGALHLDLKPENVLLDRQGTVKLTDFELGLAGAEGGDEMALSLSFRTRAEHLAGTLAYMSPEQRAGRRPDVRSDLFTFGVILFEALTGTLPEPGDRPSDFVKGLAPQVDQVFERCFARHERRYATAEELVRDLESIQARSAERTDLRALLADVPRRAASEAIPRALARLAALEPPPAEPVGVPDDVARAVATAVVLAGEEPTAPPDAAAPREPVPDAVAPPAPPSSEPVPDVVAPPAPPSSEPVPDAAAPEPASEPSPSPRPPLDSYLPAEAAPEALPARPPLDELLAARDPSDASEVPPERAVEEAPRRLPAMDGPG